MKAFTLSIGALVAALSLTYGLAVASASLSSTATGTKVGVADSNLGRILVDKRGRTLYLFARDTHGKSTCSGACAGYWPALTTKGKPSAISGARRALLGTTRRNDGRLQAYNATNGNLLWSFQTGAGANDAPTIFQRNGKEYVTAVTIKGETIAHRIAPAA